MVLFAEFCGLALQEDRSVRFRCEACEEEDNAQEDEERPVDPAPVVGSDADPATEEWSEAGTHAAVEREMSLVDMVYG